MHERALAWLYEERWLLAIFVAALIVRIHWNTVVHPLGDYVYSDMNGYVQRAALLLDKGLEPHEYSSFFPYGTHWLVAGIQLLFGRDNFVAVSYVYAVMGATTVALGYAVARRASFAPAWVAPAVGLAGIFYYPHISLGGYVLSEVPFAVFMMAAVLLLLRTIDTGRYRDAIGMGVCVGLATVIRPQMLLSVAFIGLYWILRRKAMPKLTIRHLLVGFIPIAIMLAFSAWLLHHNTGRRGLVSENGSFNLVFGRCHNEKIQSMPDGEGHGRVHFRPPEFLQINANMRRKIKEGEEPAITLDPALTDTLTYRGYIGDKEKHMEYIRQCIEITGWTGQLEYSWTNFIVLWRHNIPWPDSGRAQWRNITRWWTQQYRNVFWIPSLLGMLTLFMRRRWIRQAMVSVNLLALLVTAAIFFGGIRHRTPYDYLFIFLACEAYAYVAMWALRGLRYGWARWVSSRSGGSSEQKSSSS